MAPLLRPAFSVMRIRSLALLALALGASACVEPLSSGGRSGFVSLVTYSDGSGGFALDPFGSFFDRSDIVFLPGNLESCQISAFSPGGGGGIPVSRALHAGDQIELVFPTHTDILTQQLEGGFIVYRLPPVSPAIAHTPGDSVTVNVPGGNTFPTATARAKTAEPFTHDPLPVPTFGQPINLAWTTPQVGGSVMIVSLRYATATSTGEQNEQVFCAFNDDGSGIIPSFVLSSWTAADTDQRTTLFARLRVREVQVGADTRFTVTSSYEQPLRPLP